MAPRTPNKRTPDPVEEIAALRADVDYLLARGAPPPPAMFSINTIDLPGTSRSASLNAPISVLMPISGSQSGEYAPG